MQNIYAIVKCLVDVPSIYKMFH